MNKQLKPQDIALLLKIISMGNTPHWQQKPIASELCIAQSQISQAITRLQFSGLLIGKKVNRKVLMGLLKLIRYIFPEQVGEITWGVPTARSATPLRKKIKNKERYVWPLKDGKVRGQSITPLYPSVTKAAQKDKKLYELLALVDVLRIGNDNEVGLALKELEKRILI